MALFLTEEEVTRLLPMNDALRLVEQSFRAQNAEAAVNRSRERIVLPHFSLHYMAAALVQENLVAMKIYTVARGGLRFLVLLYDGGTGELRALMEADQLGRIRTGAASGVATKYLARPDAERGWEDVIELHQVVAGKHSGRTSPEAVTIFKSNGIALWDLAVATHIERQARAKGLGRQWDMLAT